jgi:chemotaxis protein MotB
MNNSRPIIIIKKKVSHGGHHGGAWKVAYADFVTAMMALFIVLWLLNTSKPVKEAIAGYFKDPSGTGAKLGKSMTGNAQQANAPAENMQKLKSDLEHTLEGIPDFEKLKNQIEMTITPEGLRIELLETATGTFFDLGNRSPNAHGQELLGLLAEQLGKLPNSISIEGHTDSKPFAEVGEYSNWELSTDRANAPRRLMQEKGLGTKQVAQVRGYADQLLRTPDDPLDASNRRISVIVQYLPKAQENEGNTEQTSEDKAKEKNAVVKEPARAPETPHDSERK